MGAEHDQRRADIVTATLRVISRNGLEAVNIRDVAAEAGVSAGRVQHYFGTKNAMLKAAFERISSAGTERIQARIAASGGTPPEVLRLIAAELIPIDDEHREALRIGFAFTATT